MKLTAFLGWFRDGRVAFGFALTLLAAAAGAADPSPDPRVSARPLAQARGGAPGFQRVSAVESGVVFTNALALERYTTNQIYLNGSGVSAGDIDGDGWTDLCFAGFGGQTALYRNRGGWRFENVTTSAGLASVVRGLDATGVAFADVDGDGDLDLVINSVGGGTHVLLNDGQGHFGSDLMLNAGRGGTSLALADLDGDGDLDLYVANYRTETLRDQPRTNFRIAKTNGQFVVALVNGRPATAPELAGRFAYDPAGSIRENGEPDVLFRNEGAGRFAPWSFTDRTFLDEEGHPLAAPLNDWGLSVMIRDLNGDGWPDIYVCNDFASPDRFWAGQRGGTFRAVPLPAWRNSSKFSMGVDAADLDRDGVDDFFVLDMMSRDHVTRLTRMDATMDNVPPGTPEFRPQFARSTLQVGRGDGTFAELAQYAGLEASEWAWTPLFVDVDLDGFEDLLIATGHARDDMHIDYGMRIEAQRKNARLSVADELALRKTTPAVRTPCLAYRNRGGFRFEERPGGWGWGDQDSVSQGACLADLDNDGDLEVIVNRLNDGAALYRNEGTAPRVAVRLRGLDPNTRGIGARIVLTGGVVPRQSQEMQCGGRYLSADDALRVFAAATNGTPMQLEVRWRSGRVSRLEGVLPNRVYEIAEDASTPPSPPPSAVPPAPLFVEESARLGYRHYESAFDDLERQPLLPRRQSTAGPALAWLDLNQDGRDDLFISSGRGGRPGIFLNLGGGKFSVVEPDPASHDLVGVVALPAMGTQGVRALVSASAYESGDNTGARLEAFDHAGVRTEVLALGGESPGPLALADVDGDGDLDLFVGGTALGGRYPEASPSHLYLREGETWRESAPARARLANVGLVEGALWSDLDADGYPELVLAGAWGPVRVFHNERGALREVTQELGLAARSGWWTGVAVGDFDEDGRVDLVVGNWGENSRYRATSEHPVRLYFGDLAGQGQVELVEASFDAALRQWVPERDLTTMAKQFPWVRERFATHEAYARASVSALLEGHGTAPRVADANCLASTVWLNRGDHFEPHDLPAEAQWSATFGVSVADFDLDGHQDVFLAQNFFGVNASISRQDAGRGLLLLGDGHGGFRAASGEGSGIRVSGEQRGTAVADYDGDGRPDLVVGQNAAEARLFRNATPAAGLALRLQGGPLNPTGIGAVVRFRPARGDARPAHVLTAGSGYRSQDSPTIFLPRRDLPGTVEVRWPGGQVSRHPLATDLPAGVVVLERPRPQP